MSSMRVALWICGALAVASGCRKSREPDAYGNFEATEVVVSAQATGQLWWFTPVEGMRLASGAIVGVVDTTQLDLERALEVAQKASTESRVSAASREVAVYETQLDVARRTLERTRRLADQRAATAQQLDQAERDVRVLADQIRAQDDQIAAAGRQIATVRAERETLRSQVAAAEAQVAQVSERIGRAEVRNPSAGTVLVSYANTERSAIPCADIDAAATPPRGSTGAIDANANADR